MGGELVGVFRPKRVALFEIILLIALLGLIFVIGPQSGGNLSMLTPCTQFKIGGAQI
jgi:hypothetical protein